MQCITKSLASFNSPVSPNANIPLSAFLRWKVCLNQLIFEVYSPDSQRFKSFESTCLSSGRQRRTGLSFHCRCWTMEQCFCNNTHSAAVWDFLSEDEELNIDVYLAKTVFSVKNITESLIDISLSSWCQQDVWHLGPTSICQGCCSWGERQPDVVVGVSVV